MSQGCRALRGAAGLPAQDPLNTPPAASEDAGRSKAPGCSSLGFPKPRALSLYVKAFNSLPSSPLPETTPPHPSRHHFTFLFLPHISDIPQQIFFSIFWCLLPALYLFTDHNYSSFLKYCRFIFHYLNSHHANIRMCTFAKICAHSNESVKVPGETLKLSMNPARRHSVHYRYSSVVLWG